MPISSLTLEDCYEAACLHQNAFFKGWSEKDFQELLQNYLTHGLKVEENHNLHGYIVWREMGEEAEILTLVVNPPYQRKGVGSLLLTVLSDLLLKKGITKLFLEVAEDNSKAKYFYIKNEFIFLSKRQNYYQRENDKYIPALNFVKILLKKDS